MDNDTVSENKTEQDNSFTINVKYHTGYCDIDPKNILTSALQESYAGWGDNITLDTWSFEYQVKNSAVELVVVESKYDDETYKVVYNQYKDEHNEMDKEDDIFNFVKDCIQGITNYPYRSVYSMDYQQIADIEVLSVSKVGR